MLEGIPDPAEIAAYREVMSQMHEQLRAILRDASERHESHEVITQRYLQALASMDWDEAAMERVEVYLATVEDGSPIRPLRHQLLADFMAESDA
jgi:hypothetical protein